MLVLTVGALLGGALLLAAEVAQRRAGARVPSGSDVPERTVADAGRWPLLAWFGLAAFSVLVPAALANRRPELDDIAFAVLVLGFVGDRAFYLLRRRRTGDGAATAGDILALVLGAAGVLLGLTA